MAPKDFMTLLEEYVDARIAVREEKLKHKDDPGDEHHADVLAAIEHSNQCRANLASRFSEFFKGES